MQRRHLPCPCGLSSDAYTEYDNGGYCFSCAKSFPLTAQENEGILEVWSKEKHLKESLPYPRFDSISSIKKDNLEGEPKVLTLSKEPKVYMKDSYRNLNSKTLTFYKVIFKDNFIFYPYNKGDGYKVRNLDKKEFYTEGNMRGTAGLFGKELFPSGGKALTITEGENDAMAAFQMNGGYPSVSVRSSSQAVADCKADYDYINSFDRIYLCFDSDEPGQNALKNVAALFNPNKVYHVKLTKHKDAHAYLENNDIVSFNKEWWASKPYLPTGIVGDYDSILEILNQESSKPIATYPYKKLQDMTYGIRLGEINLFTAQEKVGKTEIMRSLEYHLLKTTDENIGIIHLEEPEKRTIQGLVGYELRTPVHLPDSNVSTKEAFEIFKGITKRDNRCFLYKHFGSDDPKVILETIRYLVAVCGCKFIFLDHITLLVTGYQNDDERKTLDFISTQLAMMTRELNFTLFLVSHVNDDGKTRGSRNISKIADLIIHLDRKLEASTISERNTTTLLVKGNRWAGISGPSSVLFFDQGTFTYRESDQDTSSTLEDSTEDSEGIDHRSTSLWVDTERVSLEESSDEQTPR